MKALSPILLLLAITSRGQVAFNAAVTTANLYSRTSENFVDYSYKRKLFQRNTGVIIGLQRGKYNALELGGEAHWRKISLLRPHIIGASAIMEYNFDNNVIGYKAGMWMKRGRINFTYGINAAYFTDFKEGRRFGFGPSIGFRLLGLHLLNGYNFLTKDNIKSEEPPIEVNTLYMSLRYYIPVRNSFTWDRKTMKKKRERKRERQERKEERARQHDSGEKKGFLHIF